MNSVEVMLVIAIILLIILVLVGFEVLLVAPLAFADPVAELDSINIDTGQGKNVTFTCPLAQK